MLIYFLTILGILGMIFGSFASVLISRFYTREGGIMTGRSHCIDCKHELGALDLVPVFSYLFMRGKCRYCKSKISFEYPLLELVMGIFFVLVGAFLVDYREIFMANISEILRLLFFLYIAFVIVTFSVYDIKHQLIPTEFLTVAILIILITLIVSIFQVDVSNFFSFYITLDDELLNKPIINALLGSLAVYSFLYVQIFLFGVYYAFKKKKFKLILDRLMGFFIIPFYIIMSLFLRKEEEKKENEEELEEEKNTGVGYGDLWIALFMGLVGGFKIAVLGLILAYLIGSIVGVYVIILKRVKKQEGLQEIAFGPFLGVGLFIALLFYNTIITHAITILGLRI